MKESRKQAYFTVTTIVLKIITNCAELSFPSTMILNNYGKSINDSTVEMHSEIHLDPRCTLDNFYRTFFINAFLQGLVSIL